MAKRKASARPQGAKSYAHPEAESPMRPDVGTQAQFKKRKPPAKYRYDPSLSPALDWDGQNSAREIAESQLSVVSGQLQELRRLLSTTDNGQLTTDIVSKAEEALRQLIALGKPFLNWSGKAERLSFDVPTLPLFVHERLSTKAIIETLVGHRRAQQPTLFDLFSDPQHPIADQVLKAYEHKDKWVNRMVLGDSLAVMNSLVHYEGLGGQVQMIYMDPPYGVKFGSNFQPFVRKRDVKHNDDEHMTREPEMVQAYRDTWELGLHSYLTYLRDRLLLCRELLRPSGSVFVQISDENLHHVREVMDEVFGADSFVGVIAFKKTAGAGSPSLGTDVLASVCDYLLWYCRNREHVKYRQLYSPKAATEGDLGAYTWLEEKTGARRKMSPQERSNLSLIPEGSQVFRADNLTSQSGVEKTKYPVEFEGRVFKPTKGVWKTSEQGMQTLKEKKRLILIGDTLSYVRYIDDFPVQSINNMWEDTVIAGFSDPKTYVVQTSNKVVQRCLLMTTDPGDLVLDPTCGSGTTAYVAEQWGRRWITVDVSRVPLALARQRLLTATFAWYELKDEGRGPAGGFVYQRRQNQKGEEVGGIVPHVTLKSIANNEPPAEEVLVDRPEVVKGITRVTGAFAFEATIPQPAQSGVAGAERREAPAAAASRGFEDSAPATQSSHSERMLEVLRKSPVLRLEGNRTVTLQKVRPPAKALALNAEATVANGDDKPVAFVFGPENGAVSEKLVFEAAKEANAKNYSHLYVIGFAIEPNARRLVEQCAAVVDIPATYVQATPDLLMGDLLKNMRSSQIFSVCGLPEVKVTRKKGNGNGAKYQVELLGLDVFDPVTMEVDHRSGNDVPAWLLDTDYNGLCFHVSQAFFPRTAAWDNLKKALKGTHEESVWDHLAGTVSAPFEAGEHERVAVKVLDDRGNELLVVKGLEEAEKGR